LKRLPVSRLKRLLAPAAAALAYALGAWGGLKAVSGGVHALAYPAWLLSLTWVGLLHGAEGTLAVLALAPFLALLGYMIVVSGLLLTGGWSQAWLSVPSLAAAALSSAVVYVSSYAMARLAVKGRVWWVEEGVKGKKKKKKKKKGGAGREAPGLWERVARARERVEAWLARLKRRRGGEEPKVKARRRRVRAPL
jgi:hypothetical protein